MRLSQKAGGGRPGQQLHNGSSSGCGKGRRRQRRDGGYDGGEIDEEDDEEALLLPGLEPQTEAVHVCGM